MVKNKSNFFVSLGLFVICAIFAWQISFLPDTASGAEFFGPGSFPKGVTAILFALSLLLFIRSFYEQGAPAAWPPKPVLLRVLAMIALVLCYVMGFVVGGNLAYEAMLPEGTGFCCATFIFLILAQALMGHTRVLPLFLISAIITACLYVVFGIFFKVPLP